MLILPLLSLLGCGAYDWCDRLNLDCDVTVQPREAVVDEDGDVWIAAEDCDDTRADIYPGAIEICDGVDNDCDGEADEGVGLIVYEDADGDGFGSPAEQRVFCDGVLDGWVSNDLDCDDTSLAVFPGASERCDGVDNNCDGQIDESLLVDFYTDADGDGYGTGDSLGPLCVGDAPAGTARLPGDCDDTSALRAPGVEERCLDGLDNDCDLEVDEAGACVASGAWLYLRSSSAQVGVSVAGGDISGDGIDDLVAGAPFFTGTSTQEGAVYVQRGPITADTDLSRDAVLLRGGSPVANAGLSVAVIDDISGDGFAELLVGIPRRPAGGTDGAGTALLFLGPLTGVLNISAADAAFPGTMAEQRQGWQVAAVGDLTNDGTDDLLVGNAGTTAQVASLYSGTALGTPAAGISLRAAASTGLARYAGADLNSDGAADLLLGDAASFASRGAVYGVYGPLSADRLTSAAEVTLIGESAGDQAGYSLASPGDINQDGHDDVLVGAPDRTTEGPGGGTVYLVYGPLSGEQSLTDADVVFLPESPGDRLGSSVAGAGDVDQDGGDELLLGAARQLASEDGVDQIGLYVVEGDTPGVYMVATAPLRHERVPASSGLTVPMVLGGLDPSGDGLPDVVVGVPGYGVFGTGSGGVRIFETPP